MREKEIFNEMAQVDIDRILNKKIRTPDMVFYKQLYCYAMRRKFDLKLEFIANTLVPHDNVNKRGMVHHSVVIHSIKKMDKLLVNKDHKYSERAKEILNKIDTYEQN